jgi:hypothetical protein
MFVRQEVLVEAIDDLSRVPLEVGMRLAEPPLVLGTDLEIGLPPGDLRGGRRREFGDRHGGAMISRRK